MVEPRNKTTLKAKLNKNATGIIVFGCFSFPSFFGAVLLIFVVNVNKTLQFLANRIELKL